MAGCSRVRIVLVIDSSKRVERLGAFPLPLEVVPFGRSLVQATISARGIEAVLRMKGGQPLVTDNGNHILDCGFVAIDDPARLDAELKAIPGVVETGLFVGLVHQLIVGQGGQAEIIKGDSPL